jgi:predicted RNA-binding Zn-ribbon protein involved in translation (DUF1610 family)
VTGPGEPTGPTGPGEEPYDDRPIREALAWARTAGIRIRELESGVRLECPECGATLRLAVLRPRALAAAGRIEAFVGRHEAHRGVP